MRQLPKDTFSEAKTSLTNAMLCLYLLAKPLSMIFYHLEMIFPGDTRHRSNIIGICAKMSSLRLMTCVKVFRHQVSELFLPTFKTLKLFNITAKQSNFHVTFIL